MIPLSSTPESTVIPSHLLEFGKEVAALAAKYELRSVALTFTPNFDDLWSHPISMNWQQGRHGAESGQLTLSSTVQVTCRIAVANVENGPSV